MLDPTETVPALSQSSWWSIALRGFLAVAFGVIVLSSPGIGLAMLILTFAIYAAADGIASLTTAVLQGRAGLNWGFWLVEGIVGLAVAALAIARPGITLFAIVLLVAFRALVLGLFELGSAFAGRELNHRWLLGITGLVSVLFGVLLIAQPLVGGVALVWMIGVYACVVGVMLIGVGLRSFSATNIPSASDRRRARHRAFRSRRWHGSPPGVQRRKWDAARMTPRGWPTLLARYVHGIRGTIAAEPRTRLEELRVPCEAKSWAFWACLGRRRHAQRGAGARWTET